MVNLEEKSNFLEHLTHQVDLLFLYCLPQLQNVNLPSAKPPMSCPPPPGTQAQWDVICDSGRAESGFGCLYKVLFSVMVLLQREEKSKEAIAWHALLCHWITGVTLTSLKLTCNQASPQTSLELHSDTEDQVSSDSFKCSDCNKTEVVKNEFFSENVENAPDHKANFIRYVYVGRGKTRAIECFLFGEGSLLRYSSHAGVAELDPHASTSVMQAAESHLQGFCSFIHSILTECGIPSSDPAAAKAAFLADEQQFQHKRLVSVAKEPSLKRIGDLIVARNPLNGLVQCSVANDSELSAKADRTNSTIYLRQVKVLTEKPDSSKMVVSRTEKFQKDAVQTCCKVLLYLYEHEVTPLAFRQDETLCWTSSIGGHLISLVLRLLSAPNRTCQYLSLRCFQYFLQCCSPQVVAQFFPPMAVALQRHYPVFLQPKTDVLELNLLAQYLRTFVALLLRAPYSFASKNIVFNFEFILLRSRLNLVGYPARFTLFLRELRFFVKPRRNCCALYSRDLIALCLEAMESCYMQLVVEGCKMMRALIAWLPRFTTERYWKDICVQIVKIKRRCASGPLELLDTPDCSGDTNTGITNVSCRDIVRATEQILQAMALCVQNNANLALAHLDKCTQQLRLAAAQSVSCFEHSTSCASDDAKVSEADHRKSEELRTL